MGLSDLLGAMCEGTVLAQVTHALTLEMPTELRLVAAIDLGSHDCVAMGLVGVRRHQLAHERNEARLVGRLLLH